MVKLTDAQEQYVTNLWDQLDKKTITAQALARVFSVYPWTTRLFKNFNGHFAACDPGVQTHAGKVLKALNTAIKDLRSIEKNFHELSSNHQKIGVDTQNFKLLSQAFIVELALRDKTAFRPEEHEAVYKFLKLVTEALSNNYH
ncbi:hemoglobin subunit beta-like [Hypanus sabinus]|uniref:hemoglobin subunit beta-like n=1 Tax=Hypanus sabinus TaxID=79690 RepID=UPI0028C38C53|nr:hemoglobin subunit beta-like [Hypanus sabinus]